MRNYIHQEIQSVVKVAMEELKPICSTDSLGDVSLLRYEDPTCVAKTLKEMPRPQAERGEEETDEKSEEQQEALQITEAQLQMFDKNCNCLDFHVNVLLPNVCVHKTFIPNVWHNFGSSHLDRAPRKREPESGDLHHK
jgi:hypothetical protein